MSTPLLVLLTILGLAAVIMLALIIARAAVHLLRFRGTRIITCPDNQQYAAVEVDARHAATSAALAAPHLRLQDCSRWPEKRHCGQECLAQVEASPQDCLLRTILTRWYQGKSCAFCGKAFAQIHWHDHNPALLSPERKLLEWSQLQPETIPATLTTHRPVCWNCHLAETFRLQHPDLVVDRDPEWFSTPAEKEKRGT